MLTFKRTITDTEIIYKPKEKLIIDIEISIISKKRVYYKKAIFLTNVFNKFNGEITSLKKAKEWVNNEYEKLLKIYNDEENILDNGHYYLKSYFNNKWTIKINNKRCYFDSLQSIIKKLEEINDERLNMIYDQVYQHSRRIKNVWEFIDKNCNTSSY